ncbi:MAG: threonylcarbamoyl-AMP synthase [Candidatus Sabulitectum sp.]|nr:threonylcarbamoyl-AMP synthase [Candidatus Sabulitectum sp.]
MAGKVFRIDISKPVEETAETVSSVLKAGGTVVYPSDTVYGILADASCLQAVKSVAEMKGYSQIRPFIVLVKSVTRALELTSKKDAEQTMKKHWPGSVTLILPASDAVHSWLVSDTDTVALRIPSDRLSTKILSCSGLDLVTTSANKKGAPFPLSTGRVHPGILDSVSIILDSGPLPDRKPSRIIDVTNETPVDLR